MLCLLRAFRRLWFLVHPWTQFNPQIFNLFLWLPQWACSHENESRFRTWFGPFLIWKPDFSPCERKAVSNQAFETRFETRKKDVLDRDPPRKPDSRTCERKALSERDSCVCILKMRAEAMHKRMGQSACADCAVGAKYYLAVRRSWSWLGRRLQCMWTHVVQITIPITFWIVFRNVFRNVILAHVNTASVYSLCSFGAVDSFEESKLHLAWNWTVAQHLLQR